MNADTVSCDDAKLLIQFSLIGCVESPFTERTVIWIGLKILRR